MSAEETYRRFFPLIREKCRRMLGSDEADDVAQETFVKLWRAGIAGGSEGRVLAWIYRTSTRLAIDLLRQRGRRALSGDEALASVAHAGPHADESLQRRRELHELAQVLPADELEIALLHRLDGLTQDEIAEVAGVSSRTVRRSLQRFDERVRRLQLEAPIGGRP